MPQSRKTRSFINEFLGLDVNNSEYAVSPAEAIVAENVFTEGGQIEPRPGRQKLAQDQLDPKTTIGLFTYTPPDRSKRSIVIVRVDGIYQRIG